MTATIPRATYRLQLHHGFDFNAAIAVLPYLQQLGISHVYCSPVTMARPGSLHGYDVVDPARINPELGGREGFDRLAATARSLGLGLLLDQVPNHMGVFGADNPWWLDVLEFGQASAHARWFDIDWQPPNPALAGKLLVPVLGASYGDVLEGGELALVLDAAAGRLRLQYHEHAFPLAPRSYAALLETVPGLQDVAAAFAALPATHDRPDAEHVRATRALQQRLAAALQADADALAALRQALARTQADADALDALHGQQSFRLAHWRVAADEINYRRFFDVNELAALRIEDADVFEAVQGLGLDLAASGAVDGLRIDHPDGLHDPAQYFARLQQGYAQRAGLPPPNLGASADGGRPDRPLYVVAEKIVAAHEEVPRSWAIHGSTGYRFAMVVGGVFVERRNAERMERIWRADAGVAQDYAEMVVAGKRQIARGALASELTVLANALHRIAQADRRTRDFTLSSLRDALAEVAACMPVYRSYVTTEGAQGTGGASPQDRRFIAWAVAQARQRSTADGAGAGVDAGIFDLTARCLLGEAGPAGAAGAAAAGDAEAGGAIADATRRFAMRFQQFCAPVAAKGVEDTAFYRYHRLVALNEVGGDPAVFGLSARAFHGANADRARHWPHTMLATSTHDNKRAEDVRHRLVVLSERPAAWRLALGRWRRLCKAGYKAAGDAAPRPGAGTRGADAAGGAGGAGAAAVSASDRHLLWQTLLGTLPAPGLDADTLAPYRSRIQAYMQKAVREAKQHTSWARPNAASEAALASFIDAVLGRIDANPLLADLQRQAAELAWFGAWNSISASVLKFSVPGVPDVYQGTELLDLSLVDPDNRRPVDYAERRALLERYTALWQARAELPAELHGMAAHATDGRLKLWVAWRLLRLRAAEPALFRDGGYAPLPVRGALRGHALAFARRGAASTLVVVVARKFASLPGAAAGAWPAGDAWRDAAIACPAWLPAGAVAHDVLTGLTTELSGTALALSSLLATLPVAALHIPHSGGG